MNYEITKFGNWGSIKPIPSGGLQATLDKYLQYKRQGAQWMAHPEWAIVHLYRVKTGVFPWGLIKLVERIMYAYCTKNNHSYNNKYKDEVAILDDISSQKLRDYQNDAVHALIRHNGGILCMPTGCVDKDTEFLTISGWKKISEYKEGDLVMQYNLDGTSEFVKPLRYIKLPEKEMYCFKTKYGLDQCLSLEHQVLYQDRKNKKLRKRMFCEIKAIHEKNKQGFDGRIFKSFTPMINTDIDYTDDELRLIVAIVADATFPQVNPNYKCYFNLKKKRKVNRLKQLLKKLDIKYNESKNELGYTRISFGTIYLKKYFTKEFYKASYSQLKIISEEVMYWDGCITQEAFSTTNKETADFIQYCFSATGYSASIRYDDRRGEKYKENYIRKSICYDVRRTKKKYTSMSSNGHESEKTQIIKVKPIDGYKYCFEVPSSNLVLRRNNSIFITGNSGKTITIIEYLKLINKKSLVIVPTLDIKKQWEEYKLPNLLVSTYQNPKLKDKQYIAQFKIICFDEAHHVSAKSIYSIAMKTETNTILIGISATLKREDGEDMKIQAALGDIVYEITRKELIEKGWLCNAEVRYLKPEFKTSNIRFMTYQEVYNSQVVNNEHRNELIIKTAFNEFVEGRKILILVTQVDHGQKLLEIASTIMTNYFVDGPRIVFMNGKSKDRNRDMNQYDIIIATGIYDEGYNLPSLDCLILAAGGKSSIKLTQRIGRVLRIKPKGKGAIIYDLIDSIKYLKVHYSKRRKILEQDFIVKET